MDRAFSSGASGTPPSAPVSPSSGYATSGNPGTGTPATKPGAWWYHMVTEELRKLIVDAGLTPDYTNTSQISQAVQAMIAAGAANDYKASVRAATTANITTLAGGAPNTLDGVTLVANDRILVKDQATASQNGLYYVATLGTGANGTWTRATDADQAGELTSGAIVAVEEGTTNADSQWMLTTDGTITIGTTSLAFTRLGGSSNVNKLPSVGASVAANALTVTIGAETLDFRSTTLTSGAPVSRQAATQGSLVVPSGATLGTVSGQQSRLVWGWLDNAGTLEPFIVNLSGGNNLDETTLISTTAISAAATAANVIYSTTARTSVAFRIRGFCDITEAAAGTWATAPTLVQPAGGEAQVGKKLYPLGNAPVFGVRAWCTFDGTLTGTNAPIAGGNVTSVTRTAAGTYQINFTNPMPDTNYGLAGMPGHASASALAMSLISGSNAVGSCLVEVYVTSNGANGDYGRISLAIFR